MKKIIYAALIVLVFLLTIITVNAQEFGITKQEVSKISNTGHNVQLWEVLPEYTRDGEYEVSIKHAVEGERGSFFIMAWADTDNDGKPDKEIGRSGLKTASSNGEWSSWKFTSNYNRIFVGNCWDRNDENMYYQNGGTIDGYTGLSNKVYFSRKFNGDPGQSVSPRFTNIKVKIIQ